MLTDIANFARSAATQTIFQGGAARIYGFSNCNFKATAAAVTATKLVSKCLNVFEPSNDSNLIKFSAYLGAQIIIPLYIGYKTGQLVDPQYNYVSQSIKVGFIAVPSMLVVVGAITIGGALTFDAMGWGSKEFYDELGESVVPWLRSLYV